MSVASIDRSRARLSFRGAVWLFPFAYALHVLEELPRFTSWAQHYASSLFTRSEYIEIHVAGIIGALIAAAAVWRYPNRIVVLLYFTFMLTPAAFYNTLFHTGATLYFGAYCPGLFTSVLVYLPMYSLVSVLAFREGRIKTAPALISCVVSGVYHVAEVGHNVFKAW